MSSQRPRPWHNPTALDGFRPMWEGQFDTFEDWVDHASRALVNPRDGVSHEYAPMICIDARGRRCFMGAQFMRARDEDAFPIRYFWEFEESAS